MAANGRKWPQVGANSRKQGQRAVGEAPTGCTRGRALPIAVGGESVFAWLRRDNRGELGAGRAHILLTPAGRLALSGFDSSLPNRSRFPL